MSCLLITSTLNWHTLELYLLNFRVIESIDIRQEYINLSEPKLLCWYYVNIYGLIVALQLAFSICTYVCLSSKSSTIDFPNQSTFFIIWANRESVAKLSLFVNQLSSSIVFLDQLTFYMNKLHQSTFYVNQLDSYLAQLLATSKNYHFVSLWLDDSETNQLIVGVGE